MTIIAAKFKQIFNSCHRHSAVIEDTRSPVMQTHTQNKVEIEIPQSIFELQNPQSHKATVLPDQELFKELQRKIVRILNGYMGDSFTSQNIKNNLLIQNKVYYLDDFVDNLRAQNNIKNQVKNLFKGALDQDNLKSIPFKPLLQIGTNASNVLHKDNGIIKDNGQSYFFDYTVVIPIMDYDLSGNGNHNFTPQSTNILPMQYKFLVPDYNKKKQTRSAVGYRNIPDEITQKINKHCASETLTQGTAIILHTATAQGSVDDGKSVIHESPETPFGFTRIFIIGRANKK